MTQVKDLDEVGDAVFRAEDFYQKTYSVNPIRHVGKREAELIAEWANRILKEAVAKGILLDPKLLGPQVEGRIDGIGCWTFIKEDEKHEEDTHTALLFNIKPIEEK